MAFDILVAPSARFPHTRGDDPARVASLFRSASEPQFTMKKEGLGM
jgi:hypothetical protein